MRQKATDDGAACDFKGGRTLPRLFRRDRTRREDFCVLLYPARLVRSARDLPRRSSPAFLVSGAAQHWLGSSAVPMHDLTRRRPAGPSTRPSPSPSPWPSTPAWAAPRRRRRSAATLFSTCWRGSAAARRG